MTIFESNLYDYISFKNKESIIIYLPLTCIDNINCLCSLNLNYGQVSFKLYHQALKSWKT